MFNSKIHENSSKKFYDKYFRDSMICQFKKEQERWGNDNVKCTDRHSSPISSSNITRRWKFLEKISFPLFLQPIANDCERNFIKPQNKNRGFEPTATHAHLEISQRCKPGFLSRLSTPLCICASLPLPSPAISRIRPSVSFFREERRRIMGECSTRRCKRFFGTIASVFAAVFFLARLDRSYLLERRTSFYLRPRFKSILMLNRAIFIFILSIVCIRLWFFAREENGNFTYRWGIFLNCTRNFRPGENRF